MTPRANTRVALAAAAQAYAAATLHVPIEVTPWQGQAGLPPYLRAAYDFMDVTVAGAQTLWLVADEAATPKVVAKHLAAIGTYWSGYAVIVLPPVPAYVRQRLAQRGIPFIIPGTQLYLPGEGHDYRSRARAPLNMRERLSPSAQVLLLHLLHETTGRSATASGISPELGYTLMTTSRGVTELEAAGLIEVAKRGRAKEFRLLASHADTWQAAQNRLINPVVKRVAVTETHPRIAGWRLAGLSALAEYTMLAASTVTVYAVPRPLAQALPSAEHTGSPDVTARDEPEAELEVWSYDPKLLAVGPVVDRLSLYLTLRDSTDERIQKALTELLGGMGW